jgi:hypothetical protein
MPIASTPPRHAHPPAPEAIDHRFNRLLVYRVDLILEP